MLEALVFVLNAYFLQKKLVCWRYVPSVAHTIKKRNRKFPIKKRLKPIVNKAIPTVGSLPLKRFTPF
jgi:hypothetical protein